MRNIYLIISSLSLALFLSACGSGSDGTTNPSNVQVVNCDTNTTTTIYTGNTLVKEDNNTTVTITDIDSSSKTVCVNTGSAHIVR